LLSEPVLGAVRGATGDRIDQAELGWASMLEPPRTSGSGGADDAMAKRHDGSPRGGGDLPTTLVARGISQDHRGWHVVNKRAMGSHSWMAVSGVARNSDEVGSCRGLLTNASVRAAEFASAGDKPLQIAVG